MRGHVLFVVLILLAACDRPAAPGPKADAEAPVEAPPAMDLTVHLARSAVLGAHVNAFQVTSRNLERRVRPERAPTMERPEGFDKVVTIVFGSNNRGEVKDCGCKSNPLGGLARRHTLIDLVKGGPSELATKYWGEKLPDDATVFVVDAGDTFFYRTQIERMPEKQRENAWKRAQAIGDALNLNPPDVLAIGHQDFALGRVKAQLLAKGASYPFIAANLRSDGEPLSLFEGRHVVERDGVRVAFVGLVAEDEPYFTSHGLQLVDSLEAYRSAVADLGQVDLVVLLSNQGMGRTAELVRAVRSEGLPINAAIASGSGRLTRQPEWVEGVPIVEPENRGKHFGRLDVYLDASRRGAATLRYANGGSDGRRQIQAWRNAYLEYAQARQRHGEAVTELEELRLSALSEIADPGQPDEHGHHGELETRIQAIERRLEILSRRVEVTSKSYAEATKNLQSLDALTGVPADVTAWVEARIVPVRLDIPEAPAVVRAIDRWEHK
jgi:hypothetical protein